MIAVESYYTRDGQVLWKLVTISPYTVHAANFTSAAAAWGAYDNREYV